MSSAHKLVAVAERAAERGVQLGVLVLRDADGAVVVHLSDEDTDPLIVAGMLAFAMSAITNAPDDDD